MSRLYKALPSWKTQALSTSPLDCFSSTCLEILALVFSGVESTVSASLEGLSLGLNEDVMSSCFLSGLRHRLTFLYCLFWLMVGVFRLLFTVLSKGLGLLSLSPLLFFRNGFWSFPLPSFNARATWVSPYGEREGSFLFLSTVFLL